MNKRGGKFLEYKDVRFYSSTYTLSLLNRRGVMLTIKMKKVEAVKGKEMLVGVLVKDASSETKLTIDGWQGLAEKLVGKSSQWQRVKYQNNKRLD